MWPLLGLPQVEASFTRTSIIGECVVWRGFAGGEEAWRGPSWRYYARKARGWCRGAGSEDCGMVMPEMHQMGIPVSSKRKVGVVGRWRGGVP